MKIMLEAFLHFDGTTMAIEVACLHNDEDELLMDYNGVGAKVIEFFRAKGFDVYDKRAEFALPPKSGPDEMFDPGVEFCDAPPAQQPIFSLDFDRDHVKRDPPQPAPTKGIIL